jgi:hypothetical protein
MELTTLTEHSNEPPLVMAKLHWDTEVTRALDTVVFWMQLAVKSVFAAPWHSFTVTEELVVPVPTSSVLTTVMSHCIPKPGVSSTLLHCATVAAEAGEAGPVRMASSTAAAPMTMATIRVLRVLLCLPAVLLMNPPKDVEDTVRRVP